MAKKKISEKGYVVFDTETTGLTPQHEILEIYLYHPDTGREFYTKIKPQNIEIASPRALEINGYTEEKWKDAPDFQDVIVDIARFMKNRIAVGHNIQFDLNMLKWGVARLPEDFVKRQKVYIPYHCIDTVTLAQEHLVPMGLESVSMDNIRKFLGWSKHGAHTAKKDVKDTYRLFKLLFRAGIRKKAKIRLMHRLFGEK